MSLFSPILDLLNGRDFGTTEAIEARQDRQWSTALDCLSLSSMELSTSDPNYQAVIAIALVGLLAVECSEK